MKLRIARDELLTGLQRVQGVVEKRNTMPILSNILLEAKTDGVEVTATDLEIMMRGLYKASIGEPGGITLSARKLYEILKELRDGEVELTVGDPQLRINELMAGQQLGHHSRWQKPVQGRRARQQRFPHLAND